MRKYLVIYEKSENNFSAYIPDLSSCASAGANREEVEQNIVKAIKIHIEIMKEEGLSIPNYDF